jgi:hypothetical protein
MWMWSSQIMVVGPGTERQLDGAATKNIRATTSRHANDGDLSKLLVFISKKHLQIGVRFQIYSTRKSALQQ